jgi:hypothetical protein
MDNGPHNLAVLRHMALNLVRKESSKGSLPKKLRRGAWSDSSRPGCWLKSEMRLPWIIRTDCIR